MKPVASAGSSVDSPPSNRVDDPLSIAHRGFAGTYPENTHAAMRAATGALGDAATTTADATTTAAQQAAVRQADGVEIDVVPCETGELVVFHDARLGRLTDAPGTAGTSGDQPIWETPFERLRELEVLNTGETVPLLAELLDTIPADVPVHVEFKRPGTAPARTYRELTDAKRERYDRGWEAFAERFIRLIDGFDHDIVCTSSFEGALRALAEYAPDLPAGYLIWDSVEHGLAVTDRYDCELICPPRTAIAGTSFFNDAYDEIPAGAFADRDLLAIAHERGREVYAWTIDTPQQASELRAAGVDGLLCDFPGLLGGDAVAA